MKEIFVALDTNILIDFYNIEHDIPNKLTSKRKNYLKIILRKIKSENLIIVRNGEQARINFVYTDTVRDELYNGFVIGKPGEIFNFLRYYNINFDTVNKKEKDLCQNILLGLMDKSKGQSIISEKNDATILSEAAAK